jgi:hypothetical protein
MGEGFKSELEKTISETAGWARRNYIYAHAVFVLSVLGSFLASVLAAGELGKMLFGENGNRVATAVLAAIPALMLLINNTLRFEDRTKWFWRKNRLSERYYRRLRDHAEPDISSLSDSYGAEVEKLESEWPAFGNSPGQPNKAGI